MELAEVRRAIERVRRAMPRNQDVMTICDAAETKLVTLPPPPPVTLPSPEHPPSNVTCPACLARAEANRKRVAKFRAK